MEKSLVWSGRCLVSAARNYSPVARFVAGRVVFFATVAVELRRGVVPTLEAVFVALALLLAVFVERDFVAVGVFAFVVFAVLVAPVVFLVATRRVVLGATRESPSTSKLSLALLRVVRVVRDFFASAECRGFSSR